jgi:hypothetical protein
VQTIGDLFSGVPLFFTTVATIFIAGAIYGIGFTLYLAARHRKKFKRAFIKKIREPSIIKRRFFITLSAIILLVFVFFTDILFFKIIIGFIAASLFFGHYLMIIGKVAEEELMISSMHVSKLTEGEWIKKEVIVNKKVICGPKDKLGISTQQIAELKKYQIKTVLIKKGIPFIPGFLLGYIIIILVGNWMNIVLFF